MQGVIKTSAEVSFGSQTVFGASEGVDIQTQISPIFVKTNTEPEDPFFVVESPILGLGREIETPTWR